MICVHHKRCSPRPFVDRPNYDLAKVFFVALRGPPWTKGSCSRRCSSSCSFVALRGQKRCSPPPFVDRPNHDLEEVFFVVLRVPSWPFVDKKGVPRVPSWTDQIMIWQRFPSWPFVDKKGVPRVPSWTDQIMIWQRFPSWPFAALRGQKEVAVAVAVLRGPPCPPWTNVLPLQFFVFLRGPSWTKKVFLQSLRGQTIFSHRTPFPDYINYR